MCRYGVHLLQIYTGGGHEVKWEKPQVLEAAEAWVQILPKSYLPEQVTRPPWASPLIHQMGPIYPSQKAIRKGSALAQGLPHSSCLINEAIVDKSEFRLKELCLKHPTETQIQRTAAHHT